MSRNKKVLVNTRWITLTRVKNLKSLRVYYTLNVDLWSLPGMRLGEDKSELMKAVVEHFNPGRSRGPGWSWKFRNREAAEQLIAVAIMKWGA